MCGLIKWNSQCFVEQVITVGQNVIINEVYPLQEHHTYLYTYGSVFITAIVVGAMHECAWVCQEYPRSNAHITVTLTQSDGSIRHVCGN